MEKTGRDETSRDETSRDEVKHGGQTRERAPVEDIDLLTDVRTASITNMGQALFILANRISHRGNVQESGIRNIRNTLEGWRTNPVRTTPEQALEQIEHEIKMMG